MKAQPNRWIAGIVLSSIVTNQGLLAYGPERSFWEERHREQTRRSARMGSGLLASAPRVAASFGDAFSSALPVTEKSVQPALSGSIHFPKSLDPSYRSYFAALPLASATVCKISLPPKGAPRGLVFHIQDVHRNLEAQTNIAHVVSALINGSPGKSPIALVGLEGAFRPYDLSWLRSFPDPRATRIAAEDLLAQDRMSGPMFSVLTAPQAIPPVVGIDD